ncbi:MAG: methyltransferase domain-containing protein [Rhodospirillales bacterium]|nr:methyltransferase domain-containing protein [Rhodospirillales bacterium]
MTVWNTQQYLKFAGERLRPALDLMGQITLENPKTIVDLGCGPGNVTEILAQRFPNAQVTGLDSSQEMLIKANEIKGINWQQGDVADWNPETAPSLVFSNAALHWLGSHGGLFTRLMSILAPGGELAVQMPHNHRAPSHTCIGDTVASGPWEEKLAPLLGKNKVEDPAFYYDLLKPLSSHLSIWETEYYHVLEGENPVVEWTKGTALKGFLDALGEREEKEAFLAEYSRRIAQAFPKQSDGNTLLPFRRLFIVVGKP